MLTSERIDPTLLPPDSAYDRESMALHVERYAYARGYVRDVRVVDCACGTGYGSEILADGGARSVSGVDIDAAAIDFAREHHARENITYCVGDAFTFQPGEPPDVWVTLETVEHLPDPERYLRAVRERLAPGGILIASVPTTVSTDGNPFHLHDFSRASWRRLVSRCGFVIEDELVQTHRYQLGQILDWKRGGEREVRRSVLGFYLAHPGVALRRLLLTLTRGFVHEYTTVVARARA